LTAMVTSSLNWCKSQAQALSIAQNEGKFVLLIAGRNTCGNTRYMREICESNISVHRLIEHNFVPWFGSRLAVLKRFRGKAGKILIQKAVEVVKVNDAKQFMAYIQKRNVPLFKRLKWKPVGQIVAYHHEPHQLMEAKLD